MFTKDTPEKRREILQYLQHGHSFTIAAGKAGITRETLFQWRKADKDFADQCDAAACEGLADIEDGTLTLAKGGDFQAQKFILERRKQIRDEYVPVSHNHPFLAIQNNYMNPLAQIAPTLMKQIEQQPIEGEIVNEQ